MGNSVSCFERVSEHPPYSWPKDHPDRDRAIAERQRARRDMKLAAKQTRGRTDAEQVHPESAAAPQLKTEPQQLATTTPAADKSVEEPIVPQHQTEDDLVKTISTEETVEKPVQDSVEEVTKHVAAEETTEEVVEQADEKRLDTTADQVIADTDLDDVEKDIVPVAQPPVHDALKLPADEKPSAVKEDDVVADEVSSLDDVDEAADAVANIEAESEEPVEPVVEEQVTVVTSVTDELEDETEKDLESKPVEDQPVSVEESTEEELEQVQVLVIDDEPEQLPTQVDDTPAIALGPDGVAKEDKPDIAGDELPSIESRRAMFDHTEDELPKASDMNRDVYDAVSKEYITLEEYRRRQRQRAQGLVKERLEKFEEIDEEVGKEKAELAAIVAARNVAQKKADWAYKLQQEQMRTPTKETDSAIKESLAPDVPVSPTTGSVAGISAKFEADGAGTPADLDSGLVLDDSKIVSEVSEVEDTLDAVNVTAGPSELTKTGAVSDATEKIEAVEAAGAETPSVVKKVAELPGKAIDTMPASVDDETKHSAELAEIEGNTISVPQMTGS
ncbi:unnamed protein product [Agarophyton chilense]|eukprot:gb/GEZJ01000183.1/.p1 GENE.gb/GEZJ01000183.1/~~gb/GEZJ01000183.1/.p1  ORF type:complete len:560 (-),score=133.30 gb/GEZJ01000183.1/:2508-4187(-)